MCTGHARCQRTVPAKAGSTLRSSRAAPHPITNRARRLTPEVGRDPVHSTRYGRQQWAPASPARGRSSRRCSDPPRRLSSRCSGRARFIDHARRFYEHSGLGPGRVLPRSRPWRSCLRLVRSYPRARVARASAPAPAGRRAFARQWQPARVYARGLARIPQLVHSHDVSRSQAGSLRSAAAGDCWACRHATGPLGSTTRKAGSTPRSSRAAPHPSTNRALRRLTSEVGRDPVHSTRYGRQREAG